MEVTLNVSELAFVTFKLLDELRFDVLRQQLLDLVLHESINQARNVLLDYVANGVSHISARNAKTYWCSANTRRRPSLGPVSATLHDCLAQRRKRQQSLQRTLDLFDLLLQPLILSIHEPVQPVRRL